MPVPRPGVTTQPCACCTLYESSGIGVVRSLSPVLHNRALEARGLDAVYVPLQAEALAPFIEALPALGLSGFSVTRPYKVEILEGIGHVPHREQPERVLGLVSGFLGA